MAKSTPRGGARGAQPARAAAKSKKPATVEVEVVEDAPGMGIDAGLAVFTTVALVAALVLMDMLHGHLNQSGFLFKQ